VGNGLLVHKGITGRTMELGLLEVSLFKLLGQ